MTFIIETVDEAQEKALITILEGLHIPYTQCQTVDQYNQQLEEGDAAINRGEFITNEQIKHEMKKW